MFRGQHEGYVFIATVQCFVDETDARNKRSPAARDVLARPQLGRGMHVIAFFRSARGRVILKVEWRRGQCWAPLGTAGGACCVRLRPTHPR